MKIMISAPTIPPVHSGAGRRAYRQAKTMIEMGFDVSVMTATPGEARDGAIRIWRLPPIPRTRKGRLGKVAKLCHLVTTFLSSLFCLLRDRPDILHVISCFKWSQAVMLAARCLRIPFVAETTALNGDSLLVIRGTRLGRLSYKCVTGARMVVNISPPLGEAALGAGLPESRQMIIPNDVDTTFFTGSASEDAKADLRKTLGLERSWMYIICVAGWWPNKGIDRVLDAFTIVAGDHVNLGLILCGPKNEASDGRYAGKANYAKYIDDTIVERGLVERVICTGYNDQIHLWMRASDIFVHAAAVEGFGNVIIEAMSSELPVAVMMIPGITDWIVSDQVDGFIEPSVAALAKRVRTLCDDPQLRKRMGSAGRQSVINRFGTDVVMKRYIELFRNCL